MEKERKDYLYNYQKEKLKRIPLDVTKEKYEVIKAHAAKKEESVNGFIKRAIAETIVRDRAVSNDRGDASDLSKPQNDIKQD